jgi:DNA-binding NarL/FixJ family response regulator
VRDVAVAVIDDDEASREACAIALERAGRRAVPFSSAAEALRTTLPELILIDMELPGESAGETIEAIRKRNPNALCVAITAHRREDYVFEALRAGAVGYVLKPNVFDELPEVLRTVEAGGSPISPAIARRVLQTFQQEPIEPLTGREKDILECFVRGESYDAAASSLGISIDTVRTHVRRMYGKLRVKSRTEAVVAAIRRGLLR